MSVHPSDGNVGPETLAAAQLLLKQMGVSPQDLLGNPGENVPVVPTFPEYIPEVMKTVGERTRRLYWSYWKRVIERWPARRLDEVSASELRQFAEDIRVNAVQRRNGRGGYGAVQHFTMAMRCLYKHAVDDRLISKADNPARRLEVPRRPRSTRRGLHESELAAINKVAAGTGNDPVLDTLILRLHTETACRVGGALALEPGDLDPEHCLIRLREKDNTVRWQPVSPTLMAYLITHAEERGAARDGGQILRTRGGKPIGHRRYAYLWRRIGSHLPWVARQGITAHWLRHTTLTWVERNFGYGVARAYAGHTDRAGDGASTTTYIRANIQEVANALAALTGEPHPLAIPQSNRTAC